MNRKDFKGNVWRELCARAIESNCGYSSGYHERFALSWTVGVYCGVPDFDDLFLKALVSDYGPGADAVLDPELLAELKEEWDSEGEQERQWYSAIESMQWGVKDADTYRTVRPEIAARYGLPYYRFPQKYKRRTDECAYHPARKEGWILENPYTVEYYDVTWEFHGRGGKHLCLTEFEGRSLEDSSDNLAEAIRNDESGDYPNEWCQKLVAFIHECDLCFTDKIVKNEFEYQITFQLAQRLEEVAEETKAKQKEAAERQFWAERDVMTEGA